MRTLVVAVVVLGALATAWGQSPRTPAARKVIQPPPVNIPAAVSAAEVTSLRVSMLQLAIASELGPQVIPPAPPPSLRFLGWADVSLGMSRAQVEQHVLFELQSELAGGDNYSVGDTFRTARQLGQVGMKCTNYPASASLCQQALGIAGYTLAAITYFVDDRLVFIQSTMPNFRSPYEEKRIELMTSFGHPVNIDQETARAVFGGRAAGEITGWVSNGTALLLAQYANDTRPPALP